MQRGVAAAERHARLGGAGDADGEARLVRHRARSSRAGCRLRANYFVQHRPDVPRLNTNAPIDGVRPDPTLGNVTFIDAIGRRGDQGVDLSANLNYAPKRIFGAVNYRLGRAMNDGDSATSLPVNGNNLAAEWGPARNDVRHRIFGFVNDAAAVGLPGQHRT